MKSWKHNHAVFQELIVIRMEEGPMLHLLSCSSAKDNWSKLKTVYDKKSAVSIHLLHQKFFSLNVGNETASAYISKIEEIRNKLEQAGEELSDKMVITEVLMQLPDEYKHFRYTWESVSQDKQTLEELTSRLLIEEERCKVSEGATAFRS
ncbi:hypothetical protein QE152_g36190 [Popillia japonica]|uniref:Uncharacterized protein n=1 Tax=Popillia japonica TaxID=7064 RepID=A0AAW1IDI7_POPJA